LRPLLCGLGFLPDLLSRRILIALSNPQSIGRVRPSTRPIHVWASGTSLLSRNSRWQAPILSHIENASAQAGDDVLFAEAFDMRRHLPAVDTISVLIR
jgi:hypothetical protein